MKKLAYMPICALAIAFVSVALRMQWEHHSYIDRTIRAYTGIRTYKFLHKEHSDYDWYADLLIDEKDGARVLQNFPFQRDFRKTVLAGKLANPYVHDCTTCWYYLDDKGHGPYDYRLFILSGDKRELAIYELFGN